MSDLRVKSQELIWYGLLLVVGFTCISRSQASFFQQWEQEGWLLALFSVAIFVGLMRQVRLSSEDYHSVYTLDDVPTFALLYTVSWGAAVIVVMCTRVIFEVYRLVRALIFHPKRVTLVHTLFHFADVVLVGLAALLTGQIYGVLSGGAPLLGSTQSVLAVVASSGVWFLVAFALNALHVAVRKGSISDASELFFGNLMAVRLPILMLVPLGVLMALFVKVEPLAVALLLVPVVMMHNALEGRSKLIQESKSTIAALTEYLEERDEYTSGHSVRVAGYSAAVAREMGLPRRQVALIKRAGLIHDLGKIDVPDHILRKPGRLNEEEKAIMRTHTDRAVDLGKKLSALSRGLPFREAAYHHEHVDGSGQFGLRGDEIPLESRVLAVADTFDAITSDRPYRKGMSDQEALSRLRAASGTQLDSRAVVAFLHAYEAGAIEEVRQEWLREKRIKTEIYRAS